MSIQQFANFANKRAAMVDLIKIDGMFVRFFIGAINPRPWYPIGFMQRAHSAFRAGVGAVMAGQLFESQAVLRLCLEHAAYGFYIGADEDRMKRWLRRGDSDDNRKTMKKEFNNDRIKEYIEADSPVIRKQFDHLYNRLIEFGAHPNATGFFVNTVRSINDAAAKPSHLSIFRLKKYDLTLDLRRQVRPGCGHCI